MYYSSVLKGNNPNRLWCLIDNKAADENFQILSLYFCSISVRMPQRQCNAVLFLLLLSVLFSQSPIDLTHSLHSDYEPPKLLVKNIQNMTKKVW